MSAIRTPQAVVIAGPNGAGKTSSAPDLLQEAVGIDAFVNADVIAQGLAGFNPGSAAFEAGRIMLRRIDELARARDDFAFESTLAGRSAYRLLTGLVRLGYDVHIFYLWLPSPDLAVARVRRRVEAGGHDVPEPVIRRRFWRSLVNFDRLYQSVATTWRLYDASVLGGRPLIAHGTGAREPVVMDRETWLEIRKRIEEMA
ncbi:MAG: AAA family ATPase [Dehalococcoidia bacterium]|nr:AAA family ATPase [Dehalococcoidia bacterium]